MKPARDTMREEYDFSKGELGRYVDRYAEGSNVVVLEPDVAALFPDSKSVNEALRAYSRRTRQSQSKPHTRP